MIITYVLIILGVFEIVTNLFHLSKRTVEGIGTSAKRQHQELDTILPAIHFYYKAIVMFVFGILFVFAGIASVISILFSSFVILGVTGSFALYGIIQAIIYRTSLKVWPAMIVYTIPFFIALADY